MDWMEEKITIFYSKKNKEKKSQNKRKMNDKEIVRLRKYYGEWTTNERMLMLDVEYLV